MKVPIRERRWKASAMIQGSGMFTDLTRKGVMKSVF